MTLSKILFITLGGGGGMSMRFSLCSNRTQSSIMLSLRWGFFGGGGLVVLVGGVLRVGLWFSFLVRFRY